MFGLEHSRNIFLYKPSADMRKSFYGLSGLVINELKMNPVKDGIFVFMNRRRNLMKILLFDRHGFWLLCKKLEQGYFEIPKKNNESHSLKINSSELNMIIEGIDLSSIKRRKRFLLET